MQGHKDALLAAFAGFVLTTTLMTPAILEARALQAARIAAHDDVLGPGTTVLGKDQAARLAAALRKAERDAVTQTR